MENSIMKRYGSLKRRYGGLDLFRVVSAFMVCMFHTTVHLGCNYGVLQAVSSMGAVFMTAFFLLSGFSMFISWGGISLTNMDEIGNFWKKRFFRIMPVYWFTALVYAVSMIALKRETVFRTLALAPVEALGLQSVFHSLFEVSHNSGTWFISCMLICYALYPYLQELIKQICPRTRIIILLVCVAILLYAPFITRLFETEGIYSNPFFRLLEFIIGILLASFRLDFDGNRVAGIFRGWTVALVTVLMAAGITVAVNKGIAVGNYMLYNWICLPCLMFILFGLSCVDSTGLNQSKALKWMSGLSYSFFLAQLFSNNICKALITGFSIENNLLKIFLAWSSCIIIAVGIHFVERRINRVLRNRS